MTRVTSVILSVINSRKQRPTQRPTHINSFPLQCGLKQPTRLFRHVYCTLCCCSTCLWCLSLQQTTSFTCPPYCVFFIIATFTDCSHPCCSGWNWSAHCFCRLVNMPLLWNRPSELLHVCHGVQVAVLNSTVCWSSLAHIIFMNTKGPPAQSFVRDCIWLWICVTGPYSQMCVLCVCLYLLVWSWQVLWSTVCHVMFFLQGTSRQSLFFYVFVFHSSLYP